MDSQASPRGAAQPRTAAFEAIGGLVVALVLPVALVLFLPLFLPGQKGTVAGLVALWLLASAAVFLTVRVEQRGWRGIGVKRTRATELLIGVLLGIALMLLVPLLSMLAGVILPTSGGDIVSAAAQPWPIVLVAVVTAAVTEEILFRAYPVERLAALTGSPWPGAILGLVAFIILHAGSWNPAHVIGVVLPLGLLLALLYVWRRNLLIVIVAHVIVDIPLVVLSIGAQQG